ncbi:MAG TPA: type VI secretion system contractile sheath small subunit [Longimicrobiales bacterium]|nr:type VI secretion system contractile sheath small subunit [Longimicrobiales bacterium]
MADSTQKKLGRVRAPRVNITYDVEIGGAIEMKELPFVMGVLGDFTGHAEDGKARLKERQFVEVNPDNFDEVLARMKPHLSLSVENMLTDDPDAGKLGVELDFKSLDDFSPDRIADSVPALRKLLDLRTQLADLRGSIQANEALEEILQESVVDADRLSRLRSELEAEAPEEDSDGED